MKMTEFVHTLQQKLSAENINFGNDADSVLSFLCNAYYDHNCSHESDEIKQAFEELYEAMNGKTIREICQIIMEWQPGIIPEHRITSVKDRCHADELQGIGIPKNTNIPHMPVCVGENKICCDLIFHEGTTSFFAKPVIRTDTNEMLIIGDSIGTLYRLNDIISSYEFECIGSKAFTYAVQLIVFIYVDGRVG